ncbi:phosphatase 2C-like domain-containing protein [Mycena polygramma]|nr:phosphatase 2C-like domain-containing protein [Mycena polygramma]
MLSPATQKVSESGENERLQYAVTEMQGWRWDMEDTHAIALSLDGGEKYMNAFFAMYDGHCGDSAAKFAAHNVHKRLVTEESYKQGQYPEALKRAFLGTDEDFLASNPACPGSGATAVAALVIKDKIYVANAGDSRCVLSVKGEVKPLSSDHKPSNELEMARISAAGGCIRQARVNGNLAVSRALGDFQYKKNTELSPEKQIMTANPDVTCREITGEDEFLVLACDGIWDCLSSQQVVDFIRYLISEGRDLAEIGEMMCEHCLAPEEHGAGAPGCDNLTIMIVALFHGRTKKEWNAWVTDRVKNEYGYKTPSTLPQLYEQSDLLSFRVKRDFVVAQREADRVSWEAQKRQAELDQRRVRLLWVTSSAFSFLLAILAISFYLV